MSPTDRALQLLSLAVNAIPLALAVAAPRAFAAWRDAAVAASRVALAGSPATGDQLHRLLNDSALGRRWAAGPSPFGTLGLLTFTSRSMILCFAALDSKMGVAATMAAQAAIWAASLPTDFDTCSAGVATAPGVAAVLRLVHVGMAAAGDLVLPTLPFFPGPPTRVVDPGTSLYAVSLLVKAAATAAPVAAAARRSATAYLLDLRAWMNTGATMAAAPRPGPAAAAALAAARLRRRAPAHAALVAVLALLGAWCASYAWSTRVCGSIAQ